MVDISGGAELQRDELTAIEAGLDKLRRAAVDTASAATEVSRLGEEIRVAATRHRDGIQTAGVSLLGIREAVLTTAQQVTRLVDQSAALDDFVGLIRLISPRTNPVA